MDFLPKDIQAYVGGHTQTEPDYLSELERETHLKVLMPRMLSGHLQGRVLKMLVQMIQPHNILEIGTYTGYSALCMAEGLPTDGKIVTIDKNEELEELVQRYVKKAGFESSIELKVGKAMDIIPQLNTNFDLVFIDADKINYLNYYHQVFDQVNAGGYIIADNVLWSGKVVGDKTDKDTEAIRHFNKYIQEDNRVENVLFPIRDGLMVVRKK